MADYVYIQNYNKKGVMGISYLVFDQIAQIATNEVAGATVQEKKRYSLFKPVKCTIRNGEVSVKIIVKISPDSDSTEVKKEIQTNVETSLTQMTELIPFNIKVEVVGAS